jgi:hypothetical protein
MEDRTGFTGLSFSNLRKALYLMFFGVDPIYNKKGEIIDAHSQHFNSPKYKYIIPMQGNFENPLMTETELAKDTFIQYWIIEDRSLTQDDYTEDNEGEAVNRQKCVATVLVRFVGKEAETWVRTFRHLTKRNNMGKIWSGVCNAEKLEYTMPIIPRKLNYFGKNSQIGFDVRFKLYYDECIRTGWEELKGINFKVTGKIYVDDNKEE